MAAPARQRQPSTISASARIKNCEQNRQGSENVAASGLFVNKRIRRRSPPSRSFEKVFFLIKFKTDNFEKPNFTKIKLYLFYYSLIFISLLYLLQIPPQDENVLVHYGGLTLHQKTVERITDFNAKYPVIQYDRQYVKILLHDVFGKQILKISSSETLDTVQLGFIKTLFEKRVACDSGRMGRFTYYVNIHCQHAINRKTKVPNKH